MKSYMLGTYDIIVVGAGHAGCEAALAAARMGKRTLILSINLESIAMLACNPSIGGTGKGHLVREIDALGGEMGLIIDKAFIQSKMLNTSKGPAVHSLRAQADKTIYHQEMKKALEKEANLDLKQGEVTELIIEDGKASGVILNSGAAYRSKCVILATGTFLGGRIFIGEYSYEGGPGGMSPSIRLAHHLKEKGFAMRRFKTGTPARVLGTSLDYSKMTEQPGDKAIVPFSFMNEKLESRQTSCWLTYTNKMTHELIRENFSRSALFGGQIEGVGPRYCPSIEDKVNRFSDKERHQLFIEPEGLSTCEKYVQGLSTSLPEDVQEMFYHTVTGLEKCKIVRPAYAIEYDCIDPMELGLSLEHRNIDCLFCAGQFNGSSGYEEAAAQGLMAGINASLRIDDKDPFILDRSVAYIGVLIDDLITKGTDEPYRMMTSKAEYRLFLRQDNAEQRLTEKGRNVGLVNDERYSAYVQRSKAASDESVRLSSTFVFPSDVNGFLKNIGSAPVKNKISLEELLRRSELTYENIAPIDPGREPLSRHVVTSVEVNIKYEGYIAKQKLQIERFQKLESKCIPKDMDYGNLEGLRIEARQKLAGVKPHSIGQAGRIPGVSPADINVLLIHLERMRRERR